MTSLAEAIAQHHVPKGASCTVAVLLGKQAPAERRDFLAALADTGIPATVIERGLKAYGTPVGTGSVQRHRRGACACRSLEGV